MTPSTSLLRKKLIISTQTIYHKGVEIIIVSHLSQTKQTGQVCWQTIDNGNFKNPLRVPLLLKKKKGNAALLSFLSRAVPFFPFNNFNY